MSNETIQAMATALANIGKELTALSKSLSQSSETIEEVAPLPVPDKEPAVKEKSEKEKSEKEKPIVKKVKKPITKKIVKLKAEKNKTEKKKLVKKTKEPTVLDRVYNVIKRSRKGATVEKIKEATKLEKKQISNSLYKLTKKGMIKTVSRGVYVAT